MARMKRDGYIRRGMRRMRRRIGGSRRISAMRSRMGGMRRRMSTMYTRVRKRKYTKKEKGIGMLGMVAIAVVAVWFFFFKDKKQA